MITYIIYYNYISKIIFGLRKTWPKARSNLEIFWHSRKTTKLQKQHKNSISKLQEFKQKKNSSERASQNLWSELNFWNHWDIVSWLEWQQIIDTS